MLFTSFPVAIISKFNFLEYFISCGLRCNWHSFFLFLFSNCFDLKIQIYHQIMVFHRNLVNQVVNNYNRHFRCLHNNIWHNKMHMQRLQPNKLHHMSSIRLDKMLHNIWDLLPLVCHNIMAWHRGVFIRLIWYHNKVHSHDDHSHRHNRAVKINHRIR